MTKIIINFKKFEMRLESMSKMPGGYQKEKTAESREEAKEQVLDHCLANNVFYHIFSSQVASSNKQLKKQRWKEQSFMQNRRGM